MGFPFDHIAMFHPSWEASVILNGSVVEDRAAGSKVTLDVCITLPVFVCEKLQ